MNNQPIGILDSGVGGLTIWREIVRLLPRESTIYIADSKNCPYGVKTPEEIYTLSRRLVQFLLDRESKLIVLACNTVTVTCIDRLRAEFRGVPIIGTVPVIKTAAEKSKTKRIGIFSTPVTAQSQYQRDLINTYARECEVVSRGSDTLVSSIEKGDISAKELEELLTEELEPFMDDYIDTLVLGCSHFPLVKEIMQKIMGKKVLILDSGAAIARHVQRVLEKTQSFASSDGNTHIFYTTGDRKQIDLLLGRMGVQERAVEKVLLS